MHSLPPPAMVHNMTAAASSDDLRDPLQAVLRIADVIGALMEFWGFKRPMGRLWTLIYLSPEPSTAAELGERLTMSSGAVSMGIAELLKWGVVRKVFRPGDRRDFYEAETSVWKMITRVLRERELSLVRDAKEVFAQVEQSLHAAEQNASPEEKARIRFISNRVAALLGLAQIGESLLSAILAGNPIDPTGIRDVTKPR